MAPSDASYGSLPVLEAPVGDKLVQYAHLYELLHQWSMGGAAVPFSFAQLEQACPGPMTAMEMVGLLLGSNWGFWFQEAGLGLSPETILPSQSVIWTLQGLEKLKQIHDRSEDTRKAAASSYAVLSETSKKRRAGGSD